VNLPRRVFFRCLEAEAYSLEAFLLLFMCEICRTLDGRVIRLSRALETIRTAPVGEN